MSLAFYPEGAFHRTLSRGQPATNIGVVGLRTYFGLAQIGSFDAELERRVKAFQSSRKLGADGVVGPVTHQAMVAPIIAGLGEALHDKLPGAARGVVEGESGYCFGAQSLIYERFELPPHERQKRWRRKADLGVGQMATELKFLSQVLRALDPVLSITKLIERLDGYYDLYHDAPNVRGLPKAQRHRKAGRLAVGSWNAPAFTHYLAGVRPWAVPGPKALTALTAYIDSKVRYAAALQ